MNPRYRLSSSAYTGRACRSLSEAFGCSENDPVYPMPERRKTWFSRLITFITGQPDHWETK